ncbi:MAG: endo-1,4-beta-xylanase [Halococcoides sp.]
MTDRSQTDAETEHRSTASERLTDLNRRRFLQTAGVAGGATLLGASAQPVAAETHWKERRADDWEQRADQRIAENQMGDIEVVVEDTEGRPVPNAEVSVVMQAHDYGFGTAVNARVWDQKTDEDDYRQWIPELFNTAVLENGHKWKFWENNTDRADRCTQWLIDRGLYVRGHTCVWGRTGVGAIPNDVQTAIDNNDAQTIKQRSTEHIQEIISHYEGQIDEWEVVNEAMHHFAMQKAIYGDRINSEKPWTGDVLPWTSDQLTSWYQTAANAVDTDTILGVNDFNTLEGQWPYTEGRYPSEIDSLTNDGIDIDSIGFQSHVGARTSNPGANNSSPDGRLTYSEINERLANFSEYDADLKITEFDMYNGSDWSGQEERADLMYTWMKTAYGHPQVTDFIIWGFWDGRHWENEAPLFYEDWSKKPAFDVWDNLVFNEWWTDESGTADGSGVYTTSAYLGSHEVTAFADGTSNTTTVDITDPDGTTTVTVTVDAETTPTPTETTPQGPPAIDGTVPQDLDGDGTYGDFNANGQIDFPDVNRFFQNSDTDPIQTNAQYFDFTGEGQINLQDVMALFGRV